MSDDYRDSMVISDDGEWEAMMWDGEDDTVYDFRRFLEDRRLLIWKDDALHIRNPYMGTGITLRLAPSMWLVHYTKSDTWKVLPEGEMLALVSGPHRCAIRTFHV